MNSLGELCETLAMVAASGVVSPGVWAGSDFDVVQSPTMRPNARGRERDIDVFRAALLAWYDRKRRDLPWRRIRDPYRIWMSEIMLQQTRVAVVKERYEQFLKRFPSVQSLAAASESSVLAEWSGLGYYRRARNAHAAAKVVVREMGGQFPQNAEAFRRLPGIGRYTAAAIASISFGEPVAVVDGNVERVTSRLRGSARISAARVWGIAEALLCHQRPGDFNQAMMELGATVCLPTEPKCPECPIRSFCRTQGRHKSLRKKPRQNRREIAYALAHKADSVLLVRRDSSENLMPDMWELPQVSLHNSEQPLFSLRHSITTTNFTVRVVRQSEISRGTWVRNSRLGSLPLTGLTKKILHRAGIIKK